VDLRCIRGAEVPAKERGRRSGSATEFDEEAFPDGAAPMRPNDGVRAPIALPSSHRAPIAPLLANLIANLPDARPMSHAPP